MGEALSHPLPQRAPHFRRGSGKCHEGCRRKTEKKLKILKKSENHLLTHIVHMDPLQGLMEYQIGELKKNKKFWNLFGGL